MSVEPGAEQQPDGNGQQREDDQLITSTLPTSRWETL
jgi:hypothetical protein